MAKKIKKKPAPKAAAKSAPRKGGKASKPAAKSGKPAGAGKKSGESGGGFKVATGSGPGPAEIGSDLVALFNRAKFREIEDKWWSPNIESIEGIGTNMGWRGREAVEAKNAGWMAANTLRGASAEGPFLGSSGFAVKYHMDIEEKGTLKRTTMEEVGVYTVFNGKIVREEFMYGTRTEQSSAAPSV